MSSFRVTGMVSGMDTESMIKELMKIEHGKVDKANQDKQLLEWQKEQYQEITTMMQTFQRDYFDAAKPMQNLGSDSAFNAFTADYLSDAITVDTSGRSKLGSFSIMSISQLATRDRYTSSTAVGGALQGDGTIDMAALESAISAGNNKLTVEVDGEAKQIELAGGYNNDYSKLVGDINDKLAEAFPEVQVVASELNGALIFNTSDNSHDLKVHNDNAQLLSALKFSGGKETSFNKASNMTDILGINADQTVTLAFGDANDISIKGDDTIEEVMSKINGSDAGVKITYDDMSGRFSLEAKESGKANEIDMSFASTDANAAKLLNIMQLGNHEEAKNAVFKVKTDSGVVTTTRESNSFEIEGNRVTLNKTTNSEIKVDIKSDTADVKDKIVKFVDAYNKLIEHIDKKTSEKRYRDFQPLTADQKKAMEEDDEKAWTEKAKSGLLRNDFALKSITSQLRQALYAQVEGAGISLKEIGISTSNEWRDGGKLTIDEDKLDKALAEKPDEVVKLFTSKSDKLYGDNDNKAERFKESGLADRLNDIINNNIKTTGEYKGYLITKAGQSGKIDISSDLYKRIEDVDERIFKLMDMLARKEDFYYRQFAAMEAAMQQYNAQSVQFGNMLG